MGGEKGEGEGERVRGEGEEIPMIWIVTEPIVVNPPLRR